MTWKPLIDDGEARARAMTIVGDIVVALGAHDVSDAPNLDVAADRAVFLGYLGIDDDEPLTHAITRLAAGGHGPALYGGAARVGWTVAHVADGEQADEVCAAIDRTLGRALELPDFPYYDLISGLVGFGVYALERGESGRGLAAAVLDHLERQARPAARGLTWFTPPEILPAWQRAEAPDGHHDLGLAHGVPGVVALMARYLGAGIEPARARALLDGAVAYLLDVAPPPADGHARFPAWLPSAKVTPMRVAWCYNDLGVATALLAAAHATGDETWRAEGLTLALACARCPLDQAGVRDAGLCHGAAGNAHIFNRLWQATGDAELAGAARAWFARAIELRRKEPIAGFPSARDEDGLLWWDPDATLLTGAVGVALALHAAVSDTEPTWDRLLLLDLAPL